MSRLYIFGFCNFLLIDFSSYEQACGSKTWSFFLFAVNISHSLALSFLISYVEHDKVQASAFMQQVWSLPYNSLHWFEQRVPNSVCMASGHHLYDMICAINIAHVTSLISCLVSISYCLLEGKSGTTIGSDFNSSFCLDPVREPLISSQCSELCYGWMLSWRQRKHKFTLRGSYLRHRQYKVLSAVYLTQRYKLWQLAIRVPVLDLVKLQNSATMGNP